MRWGKSLLFGYGRFALCPPLIYSGFRPYPAFFRNEKKRPIMPGPLLNPVFAQLPIIVVHNVMAPVHTNSTR